MSSSRCDEVGGTIASEAEAKGDTERNSPEQQKDQGGQEEEEDMIHILCGKK